MTEPIPSGAKPGAVTVMLCSGVLAEVQSTIRGLLRELPATGRAATPRLLDVGCWDGESTATYGTACGIGNLAGVEVFEGPAREAQRRGLEVARLDLERDAFPWPDGSFDVVVANQVFEHLKNIWLPLSECYRVLRAGGHFVISVPNLASLHNRLLLALGRQPTSIRTLGPHVRGYALSELESLLELDGGFEVVRTRGVGFYPLPAKLAVPFARLWTGASHTPVVVARKIAERTPAPWIAWQQRDAAAGVQTFYG